MEFHPDKCKMLRITNKRKIIESCYYIHGHELENVTEAKYLGVTLTKKMSWNTHITKISAKANNCRIFLQRNLTKSSRETKLTCYRTYVRPILEYTASVWDPVENSTLTNKIEMVQRKAARWISNRWDRTSSPTEMLKSLSLKTLEQRRKSSKIKMLFDIIQGVKIINESIIPKRQRCKDVRFQPIHGSIKAYKNSFFPNCVEIWNQIPRELVNLNLNEVKKFKMKIDKLQF